MPVPNPEAGDNRIPVTEASAEIGTDGRLRVRFRQRPGGRDRSEPPSLAEFVAALAPYRGGRMTAEQHAAVLAALAACGHDVRGPLAQGDGLRARKATLPARKVTVRRGARQRFRGQGDTFARRTGQPRHTRQPPSAGRLSGTESGPEVLMEGAA